jgi:phosphoadenosine phosphosulfate reductase
MQTALFINEKGDSPMNPEAILAWTFRKFRRRVTLACGFNALEGMAILDMAVKIDPGVRVFTLDTGKLHPETYDLIARCEQCYDITVDVFHPDVDAVQVMEKQFGEELYLRNVELRRHCCFVRKISQLPRALAGYDAWISGLRSGQTDERLHVPVVERDMLHGGIMKINPCANWPKDEVRAYIKKNDVPYNALLDRGYGSLACTSCTRRLKPGEGNHDGKWFWEKGGGQECGLHTIKIRM